LDESFEYYYIHFTRGHVPGHSPLSKGLPITTLSSVNQLIPWAMASMAMSVYQAGYPLVNMFNKTIWKSVPYAIFMSKSTISMTMASIAISQITRPGNSPSNQWEIQDPKMEVR